jgi:hypothetical protein
MTRVHAFAVVAGLALMALVQCCFTEVNHFLLAREPQAATVVYVASAMQVTFALLFLTPGLVAGFVATSHGILMGFLTGVLGGVMRTAFAEAALLHVSWWHGFASLSGLVLLLSSGLIMGITCAAAGGTGQLLRSNLRWSGP